MDRNARKIRYVAPDVVALRKESVDRNSNVVTVISKIVSRSPQGERG